MTTTRGLTVVGGAVAILAAGFLLDPFGWRNASEAVGAKQPDEPTNQGPVPPRGAGSEMGKKLYPAASEEDPAADDESLSNWIKRLQSDDIEDRRDATVALSKLGTAAKPAVPALILALKDKDNDVRLGAAVTLGKIGPAAKQAVPGLADTLKDGDADVRRYAALALALIKAEAKPAVPHLLETLKDQDHRVRGLAAFALGEIRADARTVVPLLVGLLKDESEAVRFAVAVALGRIGADPSTVTPVLIRTLADDSAMVRKGATLGLGYVGKDAKTAVPTLVKLSRDDASRDVRATAAAALKKIDPDATTNSGTTPGPEQAKDGPGKDDGGSGFVDRVMTARRENALKDLGFALNQWNEAERDLPRLRLMEPRMVPFGDPPSRVEVNKWGREFDAALQKKVFAVRELVRVRELAKTIIPPDEELNAAIAGLERKFGLAKPAPKPIPGTLDRATAKERIDEMSRQGVEMHIQLQSYAIFPPDPNNSFSKPQFVRWEKDKQAVRDLLERARQLDQEIRKALPDDRDLHESAESLVKGTANTVRRFAD